jgi:hypothetical protein
VSTVLESPTPGGGLATSLRFRRVDPNGAWLPASVPPTLPPSWNAYGTNTQLEVCYELVNGQLVREVSTPTSPAPAASAVPTETSPVGAAIAGFQTQVLPSGLIDLQVSVIESGVQWVLLETQVGRVCP